MEHIYIDSMNKTIFGGAMIFLRFGSMLAFFPGIGDTNVPTRIRLLLALSISFLLSSSISSYIPTNPSDRLIAIFFEILVGVFLGLVYKIIFSSVQLAGNIIAMQSSLGSATIYNPSFSQQDSLVSNFLNVLMVTLFFSTNLDHFVLKFIASSYETLNYSSYSASDFSEILIKTVSKSFELGLKFSAPIIVVSMLMNIASGILSKLMPSIQVFFLLTPLQIFLSFFLLSLIIYDSSLWFVSNLNQNISSLFSRGGNG